MSGIVALLGRAGSVDEARVETMLAEIDHRGPDGDGVWTADRVGLGHQFLSSTPAATAGDQPARDGAAVVTADVRLDDRASLIERVGLADAEGRIPDSRLLLAAYERWGEGCVEHLLGAFAFAIWDGERNRLFCARDHFGVKPLYYHDGATAFACASEPKALLTLPWVEADLNEVRVGDFLTELFEDKEGTFFESVRRLPPAHTMTVGPDGVRTERYWDLDPTRTLTLESDAAYVRRFRELFEQAVACRLRTDAQVAATVSGGLDSSSIAAVAREQLYPDERLRTYSGVFEDTPGSDEREYIETLVDRDGIDPEYVFLDDLDALSGMDRTLEYFDEPVHNTMHYMKWEIARRASVDGVGVVLEGAHGDNAVDYGLGRLPEMARTGQWGDLYWELRSMAKVLDRGSRGLFTGLVLGPLVPHRVDRLKNRIRGKPTPARESNPAIDPSFAERVGLQQRHEELGLRGSVLTRSARRWQYRSLMTGDMTSFLEANDVIHAAFGLEPRYPFVDTRLIEFSLAIPPNQQLRDGWTRMILRRALDDVLPRKIQWRPWKTTMNEGFIDAFTDADDELETLLANPEPIEPYLDVERLREAHDEFQAEPDMRTGRMLWTALSLATWLEANEQSAAEARPAVTGGRS